MKDWYALNIEEPVREIVRALRKRGINTECSCGHKLYIQFQTLDPLTELNTISSVMYKLGYENWRVETRACHDSGGFYRTAQLLLPDVNGYFAYIEPEENPKFTEPKWKEE